MTSTLSKSEKEKFEREISGLKIILSDALTFQKTNLLNFNGKEIENYARYFLDIIARFRYNTESLIILLQPFQNKNLY